MRNLDSIFDGAAQTAPNPFREDVFASGISPIPGVKEIHGEAMTRCIRAFESLIADRQSAGHATWGGSGRTILIAAPRAGYGKSHLVGRVRAVTESLIAPVSLPFDPARKVAWETMLSSVFNQYRTARCPQHPGCSLFDETARFFQSLLVRYALDHGVIDEKESPESEVALRLQFREVFDPRSSNRLVPWLMKRSPEIMDAVAGPLSTRWRVGFDDLVFWNRFFQDAARPKTTVFDQMREWTDAVARDRLNQFLRIASDCRPVAFIADHLDGFFGSETAGMRIAEILTELRFAVPRSVTLLCLNEDVWQSIFEGKIPSAWIDRLTGEAAPLGEMTLDEAEALLRSRLHEAGWFESDIDRWMTAHRETCFSGELETLYPREVLRRAARAWDREAEDQRQSTRSSDPRIPTPTRSTPPASKPSETKPAANVFSAADQEAATHRSRPPQDVVPASPAAPEVVPPPPTPRETPPKPESPPPAPTPSGHDEDDPRIRARIEDASAAARAAGIDVTRGLTNIEAIIADIRGGGARALSETQSPSGSEVPSRHQMPFSPEPPANGKSRDNANGQASPPPHHPQSQGENPADNPFWARDVHSRFRELEAEIRANTHLDWQPYRIRRVIQAIGAQFSAVSQAEEMLFQRPCLIWHVRGSLVCMGFESPENFGFWSAMLHRLADGRRSGKMVLFSHPSAPFNYDTIAAMGASDDVAMRYVDVIEMAHADVAILYAADRLIEEESARGQGDQALKAVARHLDPFWRRIGRPMSNNSAGAAS
ncbi:MAG: hypothetical protein KDN19_17520 [Verrucomicrobiae bacterium]|nr:hypothetical protein [Verrucomicrobiae bacterium]